MQHRATSVIFLCGSYRCTECRSSCTLSWTMSCVLSTDNPAVPHIYIWCMSC